MNKKIQNRKTSQKDKEEIIALHRNGMTITDLAKKFDLHPKTIWYHLKMANAYQYKNNCHKIEDYNMNKVVNAFFFCLITNIKNPSRLGYAKKRLLAWYKNVLQWTDKEIFWFECWKEFCGYDESRLRNKIKELVKEQMQLL